jgi:Na+/H+ antiporter NhaD/arsenite permease-like protein
MPVVASALFLAALAVIASERIHRTKAALVGASIVVVFGLLDVDGAIAAVDWETLGLLATRPRVAEDSGLARLLEVVRRLLANGSPHARAP